jgi:hypothetical protein
MKKLIILLMLVGISSTVMAKDIAEYRQERLITKILSQQVKKHRTIQSSVHSLLSRYPEKVDIVMSVAFKRYPGQYRQIMLGALSAEPVLACNVIENAIKANVAPSSELVIIAIEAEPAYAQEIVNTAVKFNPSEIESIVRVAIRTEPYDTNNIINNTATNYPSEMLSILTAAITAIPEQATNIVKEILQLFPGQAETVVTTAVHQSSDSHNNDIVNAAIDSGFDKDSAIAAAIAGGANKEMLAKLDN